MDIAILLVILAFILLGAILLSWDFYRSHLVRKVKLHESFIAFKNSYPDFFAPENKEKKLSVSKGDKQIAVTR